jgi:hypothetical protein
MKKQKSLNELIDLVENIGEINIVIELLQLAPLERWVLKANILNKAGVTANIPAPDILIDLTINLGLISVKKKKKHELYYLTDLGKELLTFRPAWADRLSEQQGQYIIANIVKETRLSSDIISLINVLDIDATDNFWISSQDIRIDATEARTLRLLQQLKIAQYINDGIFISRENIERLLDAFVVAEGIDEATLLKLLEQKRQQGALAEEYVVLYERERLLNCNMEELSNMVLRVSKKNVSAGYDIASFDGTQFCKEHNRFIEVKGTVGRDISFYITKNELETAKRLQSKYWLYCVLNVKSNSKKELRIIKNPFHYLLEKGDVVLEPVLWKVKITSTTKNNIMEGYFNNHGKRKNQN